MHHLSYVTEAPKKVYILVVLCFHRNILHNDMQTFNAAMTILFIDTTISYCHLFRCILLQRPSDYFNLCFPGGSAVLENAYGRFSPFQANRTCHRQIVELSRSLDLYGVFSLQIDHWDGR